MRSPCVGHRTICSKQHAALINQKAAMADLITSHIRPIRRTRPDLECAATPDMTTANSSGFRHLTLGHRPRLRGA